MSFSSNGGACRAERRTKIFCCGWFGAPPNTLVCPVCMGLPGALRAEPGGLEQAVRMGHALRFY
ncbi:MAG: hypothetical protein ACLSAP_05895 [Oscillospiraceae bacterium]